MAKSTAVALSGFAMTISTISCILCLFIIGFFGYVAADYVCVTLVNDNVVFCGETGFDTPWYVIVAIVMGVVDFFLTLASAIVGCVSLGGQAGARSLHMSKLALDTIAWILMLVAAASCTAAAPYNLSDYTDSCGSDGWQISCSFGVGVAIAWTVFGLLFINTILHAAAIKHAPRPGAQPAAFSAPDARADVEAAK